MSEIKQLSRRAFLRTAAMAAAGTAIVACQPQTVIVEKEKVVKETVVVEQEKVVKETVVVEKEKVVKETVVVEKEKVVTATPAPSAYEEVPSLAELVSAGELPPVEERLPVTPVVVKPFEQVGKYGGTWRSVWRGPSDLRNVSNHLRYARLVRLFMETGFELHPDICDSWDITADAQNFAFHIRQGVKWSDGAPFTSEDVMFWWDDVMMNEELTPSLSSNLKSGGEPAEVTASDAYTFEVSYGTPYGIFAVMMAANQGESWFGLQSPMHYLQQFHASYADKASLDAAVREAGLETWPQLFGDKSSWLLNPDYPEMTAFVAESAPDETGRSIWVRDPYFYRIDTEGNPLPYIDRVEWTQAASPDVAVLMAAGGEIDLQIRYYRDTDFTPLKENESQGDYHVIPYNEYRGNTDATLEFNLTYNNDPVLRDLFRDVRFRQACSLAMNREEINMVHFLGLGRPRQASFPSLSPFFDPEWEGWYADYDPDGANALLDEMGLTQRDNDGFRLRPDGETLEVIFEFVSSAGTASALEELQKEYLEDIGIKIVLQPRDRALFEQREDANELQLGRWSFGGTFLGMRSQLLPNQRWGREWQRWLASGGQEGEEPPADVLRAAELIEQAFATPDTDQRAAIVEQIVEVWKENLWVIGTVGENPRAGVIKNSLKNVPPNLPYGGYLSIPCPYADQFFFDV